jgi:membrane-associated protease RseP (regulator of RpoE activity)
VVVVHTSARSGLMVENITAQLGEFFGVKNGNGVLVRSVEKGSRAEKAGFRAGDVIVRVNDQPVHDTSDFSHALRSRTAGAVTVNVIRDKREQNLSLPLPQRKESGEMEESLEMPEIDAETRVEMSEVQDEMARLAPQMELAVTEMQSAKESARSRCSHKAMRQQMEQMKKELKPEIRQKLKDQIERLVYQTPDGGLDI